MTHTTLTPVRGEPIFDSLGRFESQIHENAANVPCPSLANGDTGHLGLTMSDAYFAFVSSHHMYTRQVAPVLFVPPAAGTGPQIVAAQAVHDEALCLFNECKMVEKILITQMRNAIEPKYIEEQHHATTRRPIGDIATILRNLFTTYESVTQTHLEQERVTLVTMDYQMPDPNETIYKAIPDYGRMCTSTKIPSTDLQLIGVGLDIFNKSNLMTKFVTK